MLKDRLSISTHAVNAGGATNGFWRSARFLAMSLKVVGQTLQFLVTRERMPSQISSGRDLHDLSEHACQAARHGCILSPSN